MAQSAVIAVGGNSLIRAYYFQQATSGLYVRMGLLTMILE